MGKKYVGQKRFSLEGLNQSFPLHKAIQLISLDIEVCIWYGTQGRLNILANIFEKPYENMFKEFEGVEYLEDEFDGDVKYHMGYNARVNFNNKKAF